MSNVPGNPTSLHPSCDFQIRYWGVTGSFANPLAPDQVTAKIAGCLEYLQTHGKLSELLDLKLDRQELVDYLATFVPLHVRSSYGGNTTCIEVLTPESLMILDAGSGLRNLGADLVRRWEHCTPPNCREAHLLLTHGHMDHTFAIPFAAPLFDPENSITIWAPAKVIESLHAVLHSDSELHGTFFPATFDVLPGIDEFRTVEVGKPFEIGDTRITAYALNHPGEAVGYAFEHGDRRLVFASDHEHAQGPDPDLATFARDADLLYLDAQYFDAEYRGAKAIGADPATARQGWGHSTVEAVVQTAVMANVRNLHLGHHEPVRPDNELAELEVTAQAMLNEFAKQADAAPERCALKVVNEGMTISF